MVLKKKNRKARPSNSRSFIGRGERIETMKKKNDGHADHYQKLVEDMPIGFAHCKMIYKSGKPVDFIYLDVNKAYEELTRLNNVTGKKITEVLPDIWQSSAEIFEIYGRVALSGRPEHFERYVKRITSWLYITVHSPEKEHFVVMVENISVRKQAEEALKQSEEHFRKIVEQAPIAMAVVGMDGTIEFINRKAVTVFGYLHEDIPTMDRWWSQAYPDEVYRKKVVADWTGRIKKSLTEGGEIAGNEYLVTCKNGSIKTIFISGVPVSDKIFVMFDDITERKQAEEALRQSNENRSMIIKATPDAISITRLADGTFLEINKAFTDVTGYTPEELLGYSSLPGGVALWTKEEDRDRMVTALKAKGEIISMEMSLRVKNGTIRTSLLSARVLEMNGEKCILTIARDITERKRMEEALKRSESLFSSAFRLSPAATILSRLKDGKCINANDAYVRLVGFSRDELAGKTTTELNIWMSPEERNRMVSGLAQAGRLQNIPITLRKKDGALCSTIASAEILVIEGEKCILSFFFDITERKEMEQELRNSENNYRTLMEQASDAIFIADKKGNYTDVNLRACSMFGYSRDEILHLGMTDLLLPQEISATPIKFKELWSGETVLSERRMRRKDGSVAYTEISGKKLGDGRLQGIVRDITERKQAEEAMRNAQQQITEALSFNRMVLESSPVGTLVYKESGECVSANQAAAKIVGGTTEELLSQNFRSLGTWKRDGLLESAVLALTTGKPVVKEIHNTSSFGKTVWFKTSFAPFAAAGENHLLFLIEDISDRKQAEEDRRALEDQLNQKQKLDSLGVLAGGIAHDFNNLLAGIYGYIDLARSSSKDAKTAEYLETTLATMSRARSLTLQLLTFAKGGFPIQKITPLIPFIQDTARFALSGSNVSCKFSVAKNLWPCNIDKDQIGQVIDNIVINAQQAMPSGGDIEITAQNISLGEKEHPPLAKGDYVKVSIKDHGIGIPDDIMPRIFDPFYTTKTKGHGLGLATSYSIITRHNGCIDVESDPGKGSTFHIYLPASAGSVSGEAAATARHKGGGTIVVMDDEEVIRDTLRQMLESMGYTVACKNDGKEALDFYMSENKAGRKFTAMIFDLTVPGGMGGIEAVKEIRKVNKNVPVFVTSGYADDPVLKNPVTYGFTASIPKPFTMEELSELLGKYLKKI
jgi:PAS domain S-box-containing protein